MLSEAELSLYERFANVLVQNRLAGDPLRQWEPTLKQKPFIESVLHPEQTGYWENWYVGANRVGKTSLGAFCGATLARFGLEPQQPSYGTTTAGPSLEIRDRATAGWVLGLDTNTNRDIIQPRYFDNGYLKPGMPPPFIPEREVAKWENENQILKLKNGSFVGFKSGEADAIKVTGGGI